MCRFDLSDLRALGMGRRLVKRTSFLAPGWTILPVALACRRWAVLWRCWDMIAQCLGREKCNPDGTPNPIPGHNLAYVVINYPYSCLQWFGFNAGGTLAATDLRMSVVAANTFIAAAAASATIMLFLSWSMTGYIDIALYMQRALAGLVAKSRRLALMSLRGLQ